MVHTIQPSINQQNNDINDTRLPILNFAEILRRDSQQGPEYSEYDEDTVETNQELYDTNDPVVNSLLFDTTGVPEQTKLSVCVGGC